ncbi:hypothetical protein CPB86DRAFT_483170 [Serendipita vermifera]|nr:hypothetical protein CPB86DRAFT_483170 [Serendipita vermifera]
MYNMILARRLLMAYVTIILQLGFTRAAITGQRSPNQTRGNGQQITTGLCDKKLVIIIAVVLGSLLVISLSTAIYVGVRRKRRDARLMEELGIESKPTLPNPLGNDRVIVKLKLPGLARTQTKHAMNDTDSIAPSPSIYIGQ